MKYDEIFKLDMMLIEAGIPHDIYPMEGGFGWQICYPNSLEKIRKGDVVINRMSYGHQHGLLEAMGFGIDKKDDGDTVVGFLTAEQAFQYFKRQFDADLEKVARKEKK